MVLNQKDRGKRGENCSAGICLNISELETLYDHAAANIFFMYYVEQCIMHF